MNNKQLSLVNYGMMGLSALFYLVCLFFEANSVPRSVFFGAGMGSGFTALLFALVRYFVEEREKSRRRTIGRPETQILEIRP